MLNQRTPSSRLTEPLATVPASVYVWPATALSISCPAVRSSLPALKLVQTSAPAASSAAVSAVTRRILRLRDGFIHHRSFQIAPTGNGGAVSDRGPNEDSTRQRRNLRQLQQFKSMHVRTRPLRSRSPLRLYRGPRRTSGPVAEPDST